MLYSITKKGKTKIGWRAAIRPIPFLSSTEIVVLRYLAGRKTPATPKEISQGVSLSKSYTTFILRDLRGGGLVKID